MELARESGWHRDTIRRALRGSDVRMRGHQQGRKWHVDHDAFSEPLSGEAWYWIGMLAADGCVLGPTIELTQTDKALLQRFLVFLNVADAPIRSHVVHQNVRSVRVRSARLASELAKHGIVERKSLSLRVSDEAAKEPAFWLGELDGDGCAEVAVAGGAPRISFLGSRALMDQCAEFIAREVVLRRPRAECRRWKRPRVRRHAPHSDRLWQVTVKGHTARELALVLLRSHHSSLARKRARLEAIARYESSRTLSQRDSRPRRCAYCRAWVDRYPSQMRTPHVFCTRSHAVRWRAEQQRLNRAVATL